MKFTPVFDDEVTEFRIGLISINSDERGDSAFEYFLPPNVKVFKTRMALDLEAYREGNFQPVGGFETVLSGLPAPDRLDLIAFNCTSGSILGGHTFLRSAFDRYSSGIKFTDPAIGASQALRKLGLNRIALLSPYPDKVQHEVITYFKSCGISVGSHGSFDVLDDALAARISEASLITAGQRLIDNVQADALFISCAALDVVSKIPALTNALKRPVFTSSQLFAWHALQLLDLHSEAEKAVSVSAGANSVFLLKQV